MLGQLLGYSGAESGGGGLYHVMPTIGSAKNVSKASLLPVANTLVKCNSPQGFGGHGAGSLCVRNWAKIQPDGSISRVPKDYKTAMDRGLDVKFDDLRNPRRMQMLTNVAPRHGLAANRPAPHRQLGQRGPMLASVWPSLRTSKYCTRRTANNVNAWLYCTWHV